jgi:hypothetical protein
VLKASSEIVSVGFVSSMVKSRVAKYCEIARDCSADRIGMIKARDRSEHMNSESSYEIGSRLGEPSGRFEGNVEG